VKTAGKVELLFLLYKKSSCYTSLNGAISNRVQQRLDQASRGTSWFIAKVNDIIDPCCQGYSIYIEYSQNANAKQEFRMPFVRLCLVSLYSIINYQPESDFFSKDEGKLGLV